MEEKAQIIVDGKTYDLPVVHGTQDEKAVDISQLRDKTSYITIDSGFANTAACLSAITFLDGEKGILRYRGIPIEEIAENSSFAETAYLLMQGALPTPAQLEAFAGSITRHAALSGDMLKSLDGYPPTGHPMGLLSSMVCSLSGYYPRLLKTDAAQEEIDEMAFSLLSKVRTMAACIYKRGLRQPFVPSRDDLPYVANFLHMMFSTPQKEYALKETVVSALETLLILHADHEQNCSTSVVRLVGSSRANLYASVSAGICALWGPLHGGANEEVVEMLEEMHQEGGDIHQFIERAKNSKGNYRLMGFGHRVYKNYDPRARIIKQRAYALFDKLGIHDPLLEIAVRLEEAVLKDEYFIQRKLYPNVDFYSGLIYKAIGIPTNMFPVLFAMGRLPGWIAHWKEMKGDPKTRLGRPRQIYIGPAQKAYTPLKERL